MEIAKLVLEYIKALVWPLTVFTLCLIFRHAIRKALARVKHGCFRAVCLLILKKKCARSSSCLRRSNRLRHLPIERKRLAFL